MDDFRIDLHDTDNPDDPHTIGYFQAVEENAFETAVKQLPELCQQAGVTPDPEDVYGVVWINNGLGGAEFYATVLLPEAYGGI